MIGRAARNIDGQVIMYADNVTDSMQRAISETNRRRGLQHAYNEEHGIEPQTIRKAVTDILASLRGREDTAPVPGKDQRKRRPGEPAVRDEFRDLAPQDLGRLIQTLEDEMHEASADLRFEYAARLRDEIKELKRELREAGVAG
jgi:excinuclease ABC subunit B